LVETYIGGKGKGLLLVETCYARVPIGYNLGLKIIYYPFVCTLNHYIHNSNISIIIIVLLLLIIITTNIFLKYIIVMQ